MQRFEFGLAGDFLFNIHIRDTLLVGLTDVGKLGIQHTYKIFNF